MVYNFVFLVNILKKIRNHTAEIISESQDFELPEEDLKMLLE
jgi:hypothetical protein